MSTIFSIDRLPEKNGKDTNPESTLCERCTEISKCFENILSSQPSNQFLSNDIPVGEVFSLGPHRCSLCNLICISLRRMIESGECTFEGIKYSLHVQFLYPKTILRGDRDYNVLPLLRILDSWCMFDSLHPLPRYEQLQDIQGAIIPITTPAHSWPTARTIDINTVDFQAVKTWVDVCRESHHSCVPRREPFRVPLTVIDCADEILRIKPQDDSFLALSYVWGPQPQGLDQKASSIPFTIHACPHTIKDAIKVTKCLGYRCLWVDRYCIDQIHSTVKMAQLAMMDLIYQSAELTIIACAGSDDGHGLPGAGTVPRKQQEYANLEPYNFVSTGPGLRFWVQNSKWSSRGWTYQEEQLSTRRLYFTENQVALVCQQSTCYEMLPEFSFPNQEPIVLDGTHELEVHIQAYQSRLLTFESDTLNAFRGVLNGSWKSWTYWGIPLLPRMNPEGGEWSSVGEILLPIADRIWPSPLSAFLDGLLWRVVSHQKGEGRRRSMPTWSWLSLGGGNVMFTHNQEPKGASYRDVKVWLMQTSEQEPRWTPFDTVWSNSKNKMIEERGTALLVEAPMARVIAAISRATNNPRHIQVSLAVRSENGVYLLYTRFTRFNSISPARRIHSGVWHRGQIDEDLHHPSST